MSSSIINLWLRIGASLIFTASLMMAPNLRTTEILAEDAGNERTSHVQSSVADLMRRFESSGLKGHRAGAYHHSGSDSCWYVGCRTNPTSLSWGHLLSGHRWANGLLAPPLL